MKGNLASVSVLALTGCLVCLGGCDVAQAQLLSSTGPAGSAGGVPTEQYQFNIPGQPLHDALQHYSAITARSLLYDSSTVETRVSAPVSGLYTAQEALLQLLAGSGMAARYTSQQAFLLVPAAPDSGEAEPGSEPVPAEVQALRQRYFARMQTRVMDALCVDPRTVPGGYRLALRFRIDGANTVQQLEVHASEGAGLASRVRSRLAGLDLGAMPPMQLKQPVTLLVLPVPGSAC
ncbi:STN domain-containing protein [Variovorax boronicumulans]